MDWLLNVDTSGLHIYFKVPTRNFSLVMKQSKFNTDASNLTYICKYDHRWGDWRLLSCLLGYLCQISSVQLFFYCGLRIELVTLWNDVMKLCTGKARHSSGNLMTTLFLFNSKVNNKRLLVFLLTFYVEMRNYFIFKCHTKKQETRQQRWWFTLRLTTFPHLP